MKILLERFHLTKKPFLRVTMGLAIIVLGSMLFNPVVPGESNKEIQHDAVSETIVPDEFVANARSEDLPSDLFRSAIDDTVASGDTLARVAVTTNLPVSVTSLAIPDPPASLAQVSITSTASVTVVPAAQMLVTAVGDSVMLSAAGELERAIGCLDMDAEVGRQVSTGIEILRARRKAGPLGEVVIVHLGNNGTFSEKQFDEIMQMLADVPKVMFVNVKVSRWWEDQNNAVLAGGVKRYASAELIDWHAASAGHPELFWSDGVHIRPEGAQVYADLIATSLAHFRQARDDR